eukprot:TRINITY_DN6408_c0_g1_i4.p1 TRINITY_DN6408_c0_g1~~TRINITY_DN6408_c0_g1_i4.p1  ORF type:complete len:273 (+),score=73.31 TRINITY_DN6408_c0_g1_i4:37-819(+)
MENISEDKKALLDLADKSGTVDKLKREIHNLNNALLQEKLQVQALSEELENPINVHRWRKLEGTDPDTYEMLQKIHALQKRLIKKTEEVLEKDKQLSNQENEIQHLKLTLARQPGPETADAIEVYKQNLQEKEKQMKAMELELNAYHTQVDEYKYEIERLSIELQEIKTKYFQQKKKEQAFREAYKTEPRIKQQIPPVARFTGGGFNLAIQSLQFTPKKKKKKKKKNKKHKTSQRKKINIKPHRRQRKSQNHHNSHNALN